MRYLALVLVLLAAAIPGPAQARPLAETGAPPGLAAWAPWVLYGQEERLCPGSQSLGGGCVWPISLRLDIGRDGGTFEGQWEIRAEKDVVLPGQPGAWPGEVTDSHDGAPASPLPVTGQSSPAARLAPGRHRISGSFSWQERPKTLTLPLGPIYDINLSGTSQGFPVLDEDPYSGTASLWLDDKARDAPAQAEEERPATVPGSPDGLTVRLDRLLIDTQPMTIITRARLTVSGSTREETIGGLLLPGSTPTALYSRIQSRLTAEGLRIQLSPGVHDVFVGARLDGEALEVGPVGPDHGQELWTFVQQPNLRQVEISGAPQIDVSMVDLPWGPAYPLGNLLDDDGRPLTLDLSGLPIYELQPGDGLSFQVLRRGDPEPGPDQLALGRECWLDFGGTGLSCRDQLDARMSRQWFLAVEPPFELGQASLNGQPQVLTWQEDSQGRRVPGLQLRQGRVDLTADLRVADFRGLVPASGWGQNLFSTTQRFNLPPGYELFYVSGAKAFDQNGFAVSWWDRWTNLDLFIVLAVILSSFRLLGPRYAVLAAVALALSYHELMAPRLVFLHVLGATALLSVLPGRGKARFLARAWRLAACVFLAIVTVVFAIQEARVAIYPQLAKVSLSRSSWGYPLTQSWSYRGSFMPLGAASSPYAAVYEPDEAYDDYYEPRRRQKAADEVMGDLEMAPPRPSQASPMDKSAERQNSLIMTAPEAKAQNSLPRPDWEFRTIFLDYNGQVAKDQTVGLALIGPRVSSVLCFLRLVLMIWLVLAVISARGAIRFGGLLGGILPKAKAAAALALLAGALPLLLAGEARAQADWAGFPSPELLDDLRSRLLERADETVPGLPSLALSSPGPGTLRLSLSVQAARESLVALPRLDPKVFQPTRLFAEGLGDLPILATEGGERVALVPGGIHELVYEGRLADAASFQVSFEGRHVPGRVSLEGLPLWRLAGLDRNGVLGGRSLFVYTGPDDDDDDGGPAVEAGGPEEPAPGPGPPPREAAPDALRPFFRVDRTVSLGTEWKLYTTVSSFEPLESPFTLAVPLVAGEKPTTGGLTILRGSAILSFGPGHGQAASWESDLGKDLERPLELVAGTGPFAEAWSLDAATFWRVETRGPTPIYSVAPSGFWNPRWRPWPGETLSISVSRPEPIPGGFLVIDRAALAVTVGQENRLNALDFDIRSSFGGPYGFDLPQGAEIQSLSLDGQNLPSSSLGGPRVSVPLNPGQHRLELTWLETRPISGVVSTPGLDLGLPVANIDYRVVLPADRWTLLAGGPLQGPAVLFWSFAAAILIFCLCLGRLRLTPLSAASWFLLFLGLSQLSVAGAFLVAGWLLVFGLRDKRWPIGGPILFNLAQIALVIWTIFALVLIYLGIQHGLLEAPAMRVAGYSYPSDHDLKWFADRASGSWPEAWALSIPDRAYRILMLAWALWLAISLIRWSRWLWASFSRDGFWRKLPPRPPRVRNRPPMPGGPPPWGGPPQGPWPPAGMGPPPDGTAGPGPDPGQAPPVR